MLATNYATPAEGLNILMNSYFNTALSVEEETRNGKAKHLVYPITLTNYSPQNRVLVDEKRDANPFFHVYEAMWMLAGRNDVESVSCFNKRMAEFSDDGKTLHGAYGHRWRKQFGYDQLDEAIQHIRDNPNTRRCVVGMWDPYIDLTVGSMGGKDVPCNTQLMFQRNQHGNLDMTVINRSNDVIWGAFGANIVHMSFVHEYVALGAEVGIGRMHTFSNNLHIYEKHYGFIDYTFNQVYDDYVSHTPLHAPGTDGSFDFDQDVRTFVDYPFNDFTYNTPFLSQVAKPMMLAWEAYKRGNYGIAAEFCGQIKDKDWQIAALFWIDTRLRKRGEKQLKDVAKAVQEERTEKVIQVVQEATPTAIEEAKRQAWPDLQWGKPQ